MINAEKKLAINMDRFDFSSSSRMSSVSSSNFVVRVGGGGFVNGGKLMSE